MTERKQHLLKLVIEHYIATAEPVGSKFLVEQEALNVSGATVRNELRDLEEEGFLTHPHTSAGRIPTETGYQFYVETLMQVEKIRKTEKEQLEHAGEGAGSEVQVIKQMAKQLAELANNAVIVGFGRESVYYTGISNLFAQPELKDYAQSVNVSVMFDQCEEKLPELHNRMTHEPSILIGSANPLGQFCSTIVTHVGTGNLLALVGPTRMDYAKNVGVLEYIHTLFNS